MNNHVTYLLEKMTNERVIELQRAGWKLKDHYDEEGEYLYSSFIKEKNHRENS